MVAAAIAALAVAAAAAGAWALASGIAAAASTRRAVNAEDARAAVPQPMRRTSKPKGRGRLAAAGLDMDPAAWASILLALAAAAGLLLMLAAGPLAGLAGAVAAPCAAELAIRARARKRMSLFDEQLARALPMVAQSVSGAGISIERALATAADNADEPLHSVLADAVASYSIDGDTVAALDAAAVRANSADMRLICAAVRTHKESGGDLSRALGQIAQTIDMRNDMRRRIAVNTAPAKSTAKILVMVPIVAFFGQLAILQEARDFYATPAGAAVIAAVVAAAGVGIALTRKFSDIDID